jgi:hypothetical protein
MDGVSPFLIPTRTSCLRVVEDLSVACTASGALSGSLFVDSLYIAQKRISVVGDMSDFIAVQLTSLQQLDSSGNIVSVLFYLVLFRWLIIQSELGPYPNN